MTPLEQLQQCTGFQWDEGNGNKNWIKHRVSRAEAEEMFLNRPLIVADDETHSHDEARYLALGHTDRKRPLFAAFTVRGDLVRVISVRDMTKREREVYWAS